MTNAEILKEALRTIHFRSDFDTGGKWEEALDGLIAELEQAKRDALPCQVLDVLDSERRAKARADRYRTALERVNGALTVPAAEYVPAIQDAFQIIDRALNPKP